MLHRICHQLELNTNSLLFFSIDILILMNLYEKYFLSRNLHRFSFSHCQSSLITMSARLSSLAYIGDLSLEMKVLAAAAAFETWSISHDIKSSCLKLKFAKFIKIFQTIAKQSDAIRWHR